MAAYIYVLHFDRPLSHAEHYIGCTTEIRLRLKAHANGAGSNLCRVLADTGIEWRLAGLATCSANEMRRIERAIKDQHHGDRYCNICTTPPVRFRCTQPVDLSLVPWAHTSVELRDTYRPQPAVRFTSTEETRETMTFIKRLMSAERKALGFIPAGGDQGLQITHDAGQIVIASQGITDCGYTAFTKPRDADYIRIHQCVVKDAARRQGHATRMIKLLQTAYLHHTLLCKVRDNLIANEFWRTIGFKEVTRLPHATSGHILIHYQWSRDEHV